MTPPQKPPVPEPLSRLERETIISFNAAEKDANIYSTCPVQIARLTKRLGPGTKVHLGCEWTIPKAKVRLPSLKTRSMGASQRAGLERARAVRSKAV